jgi:hypothetical protein
VTGAALATGGADAILPENCSDLQPANNKKASPATRQPGKLCIKHFECCINLFPFGFATRDLVSSKMLCRTA